MQYRFVSSLFLLFGSLSLISALYLAWQIYSPGQLAFRTPPPPHFARTTLPQPTEIAIPSVLIDLPIIPTHITNHTWVTTDNGVSYLTESAIPGETGNSILYGHNWTSLLGPMQWVHPGDLITIVYSDHSLKQFVINNISVVDPTDTSILADSKNRELTIYTCIGFLDSQRFVVRATES